MSAAAQRVGAAASSAAAAVQHQLEPYLCVSPSALSLCLPVCRCALGSCVGLVSYAPYVSPRPGPTDRPSPYTHIHPDTHASPDAPTDRPACAKYFIPVSRVINMGLACLMAFAAVNGIMKIVEFRLDTVFVAVYML